MPRQISEERTRKEMIDPQLETAGWYLRDHSKVIMIGRQYESCITKHKHNTKQIRFLRAVQSVFLQKRHLETADVSTLRWSSAQCLYEPPLDMFGADAVERWFTEKEVEGIVNFANKLAV